MEVINRFSLDHSNLLILSIFVLFSDHFSTLISSSLLFSDQLSGGPDKGGCVNASTLIKIVKEDFGLTVDIERLIALVDSDGSGEIEFDEFMQLLS